MTSLFLWIGLVFAQDPAPSFDVPAPPAEPVPEKEVKAGATAKQEAKAPVKPAVPASPAASEEPQEPVHPVEEELYRKLLATEPGTRLAPPEESSSSGLFWPLWLFFIVVGGGAAWLYMKNKGALANFGVLKDDPLRVVSRTGFGSNSLLLVDVAQLDGSKRRLLVGLGSQPVLVADLGDDSEDVGLEELLQPAPPAATRPEPPKPKEERPVQRSEPTPRADRVARQERAHRMAEELVDEPPVDDELAGMGSPMQRFLAASKMTGTRPPAKGAPKSPKEGADPVARKEKARSLLDDVLAQRGDSTGGKR